MDYFFGSKNWCGPTKKLNKYGLFIRSIVITTIHLISLSGFSQNPNLGIPPTESYSMKTFGAGTQNRAMATYKGRLYSANNGGLLVYDGIKWSIIETPKNSILRSLAPADGDTIYVGGQGELGFFKPNEKGNLTYESLVDRLPKPLQNFGEVWDMTLSDNDLYVTIANNQILKLNKNGSHNTIMHEKTIGKLASANNQIYYQVSGSGIYTIQEGMSVQLPNTAKLKDMEVRSYISKDDHLLIVTRAQGIFAYNQGRLTQWKTNIDPLLKTAIINNSVITREGHLILATQKRGIIQLDENGRAILLMDKDNGLQSNSAYSLTMTDSGGLWTSVGKGIDYIELNADKTRFYPDGDLEGAIYDMLVWNDNLWFATSNGLYYIEEKSYYNPTIEIVFKKAINEEGHVWGLNIIDDKLFCGHETGTVIIDKGMKPNWHYRGLGTWMFVQMSPTVLCVGTYEGIYTMELKNGQWTEGQKIKGLDETSRIMVKDKNNNLWMSHSYLKIFKISFSEDFKNSVITEYDKDSGLNSNLRNYVFEIDGQCYASNETGVYRYDENKDRFEIAEAFKTAYPTGNHLRSVVKKGHDTWAISHAGTHKIKLEGNQLIQSPSLNSASSNVITTDENYVGGFENLFSYSDSLLLTCSDSGVAQFSSNNTIASPQLPILVTTLLKDKQDSLLHHGYGSSKTHALDSDNNAIRFDFASMESAAYETPYYRYLLEGYDTDWSPWVTQPAKEYYRLEPGDYRFMVRSVAPDNSESEINSFAFSIKTPWRQSWWAILFYGLCLLGCGLLLLLIPRKRYKENTKY